VALIEQSKWAVVGFPIVEKETRTRNASFFSDEFSRPQWLQKIVHHVNLPAGPNRDGSLCP